MRLGQAKGRHTPYYLIAPCLLLVCAVIGYPMVQGVVSSLYNINLIRAIPTRFVGLQNFARLLNDSMFWLSLQKSLVWTLAILICTMMSGFAIALLLNRDIRGRRLFRSLIMVPWVIPAAIGAIAWRWIYSEQYGLLNAILKQLNIIEANRAWLAEPVSAFWAVTLVAIWKGIPFVAIVLLAGLQAIPKDLYEAAEMDGAGPMRALTSITIPQIKNIALIAALLTSIWNFNQFEIIQVVTRGGPGNATMTMPMYTYRLFLGIFDISYASALATLMLVLTAFVGYWFVKRSAME